MTATTEVSRRSPSGLAPRLCDACTVGDHSRCTGVACRSCPDPYHRPVGVACPTADPYGEALR